LPSFGEQPTDPHSGIAFYPSGIGQETEFLGFP
jgi:hypothetical protein